MIEYLIVKLNYFTKGGFSVRNVSYEMTILFDFYGDILTDKQRELFDLYYNEDLSLAEIAEHLGITRQGVRDGIVRSEEILQNLEAKLGLVARYGKLSENIAKITSAASRIKLINDTNYRSSELGDCADSIIACAEALND